MDFLLHWAHKAIEYLSQVHPDIVRLIINQSRFDCLHVFLRVFPTLLKLFVCVPFVCVPLPVTGQTKGHDTGVNQVDFCRNTTE